MIPTHTYNVVGRLLPPCIRENSEQEQRLAAGAGAGLAPRFHASHIDGILRANGRGLIEPTDYLRQNVRLASGRQKRRLSNSGVISNQVVFNLGFCLQPDMIGITGW